MRRYTTPTMELAVEGHDLTGSTAYVTFRQGSRKVTLTDAPMELVGEDTIITVDLTQLQTGRFKAGECEVQVNWVEEGKRNATEIRKIEVAQNLLDEVV